jgi:hypothetical protein
MYKIEIKRINSKWLINGKQYPELCGTEKTFFDEFLIAMRINFEAEKHSQIKNAS